MITNRTTKQITGAASRISSISDSIENVIIGVEPDFLALGEKLQSIYSESHDLSEIVIKSSSLVTPEAEGKILFKIGGIAKESVERLKHCQNEISNSQKALDSGQNDLGRLSQLCLKAEKIALLLNVIALNIAVESNRSDKSSRMFIVFADEIKQLSEKMKEISQVLYSDSEVTRNNQNGLQEEISSQYHQLFNLTDHAENVVAEAIEKIEQLVVIFQGSLEKGVQYSKEISNQISEIVMAIQFHDIVRQQIEHVSMALKDAAGLCQTDRTASLSKGTLGRVDTILKVQTGQIRQVILEIDDAYGKINGSFEGIDSKVLKLMNCLSISALETEENDGNDEDPFLKVISSLEQFNRLLNQATGLKRYMDKAVSEASSSIGGLLRHIDEVCGISLDLHRKALNAIIKSAHLGETGVVFEILAQEVSAASSDSNRFADNVVEIIESVTGLAEKLENPKQINVENNLEADSHDSISMDEEIKKVSDTYDLFVTNAMDASKMSHKLEVSIKETRSTLAFLPDLSQRLTVLLDEAEIILKDVSSWETADAEEDATEIPDSSQRYTMESERIIHSRIMSGKIESEAGTKSTPELIEPAAEYLMDDGDGEIELFGEEDTSPENIELFAEDDESSGESVKNEDNPETDLKEMQRTKEIPDADEVSPASHQGEQNELDDNIELF